MSMAMRSLTSIKKEEDFIFLQGLKEEQEESELCPFSFFVFKQEKEAEILKQEPFLSTPKKEEPSEVIVSHSSESTTLKSTETHNLKDGFLSSDSLRNAPQTQIRHSSFREKTVCEQFVPNSEVTGHTPSPTESEDDETSDPNWRPNKSLQAASHGHIHQIPRRPRGLPRKNSCNAKADCTRSTSKPMKDSCSSILPKDLQVRQRKEKKPCVEKVKKADQSAPGLKSGLKTPRRDICETCGKAFLSKRDLKRHKNTHTGAKPFTCSVCERGFSDRGNMYKHMAVHTGAQPFSCRLCGRAFSEKGNLRRHEFYVHEVQGENHRKWESLWHQCPACLKTFKYQRSLNRHACSGSNRKKSRQRSKQIEKEKNTEA